MSKQDQVVQEKVLTFKTLVASNIEEVAQFLVRNHRNYPTATEEERGRLCSFAHSLMVPALQSEWSFGLCREQQLVGVYLQVDLLDYLKLQSVIGKQTMADLFDVSIFDDYLNGLQPSAKRGHYLVTIFNVLKNQNQSAVSRRELTLIYQGFYLVKLGGWKNIIFQTYNPVPFLKINAEVVVQNRQQETQRVSYLMKLNLNELHFTFSPFHKPYARL